MAQILGNLLQNAVKFTPGGGSVVVRVGAKDQRAELCVQDNGIGMDPSTIEHMFEPFAQATQTLARARGGLGLGLALVKAIVESEALHAWLDSPATCECSEEEPPALSRDRESVPARTSSA